MTDLNDYFTHGSSYLDKSLDEPRKRCCGSCAFGNNPNTVRPKDVSIEQLENFTSDLDVFYCHTEEDGRFKICAKWFALVEGNLSQLHRSEKEIQEILES